MRHSFTYAIGATFLGGSTGYLFYQDPVQLQDYIKINLEYLNHSLTECYQKIYEQLTSIKRLDSWESSTQKIDLHINKILIILRDIDTKTIMDQLDAVQRHLMLIKQIAISIYNNPNEITKQRDNLKQYVENIIREIDIFLEETKPDISDSDPTDDALRDNGMFWFLSKITFPTDIVSLRHTWQTVYRRWRAPLKSKLLPDLPPIPEGYRHKKTLVLDLEDTIVYNTWDKKNGWRTLKRPGLDRFIFYMSNFYEIVLFSNQPYQHTERFINKIDPDGKYIAHRLFNDSTQYVDGKYIKDLSKLNRDLSQVIMIDDKMEIQSHPENVIGIEKFTGTEEHASDLILLVPFLEDIALANISDVRQAIQLYKVRSGSFGQMYNEHKNSIHMKNMQRIHNGFGSIIDRIRPTLRNVTNVKVKRMPSIKSKPRADKEIESIWTDIFQTKHANL